MMAITAVTRDKDRRDYDRTDMAMPYMGGDYDIQDRFRDRRGREHYDNGRYAPRNESTGTLTWDTTHDAERRKHEPMDNYPRYEMDEMESRRRRDRRGRFRSEMDEDEPGMHYPGPYPFPPPVYERREGGQDMRPIGFAANDGFRELDSNYRQDAAYHPMNEMEYRKDSKMTMGGASGDIPPFDEEMAHSWMKNLQNEDGTTGPHWTMEQTSQVLKQKNINCDPLEFWVAMNGVYSDYFGVAKKFNVNNIDFYVSMARAFIDDKDSQPNRLARYYTFITKH